MSHVVCLDPVFKTSVEFKILVSAFLYVELVPPLRGKERRLVWCGPVWSVVSSTPDCIDLMLQPTAGSLPSFLPESLFLVLREGYRTSTLHGVWMMITGWSSSTSLWTTWEPGLWFISAFPDCWHMRQPLLFLCLQGNEDPSGGGGGPGNNRENTIRIKLSITFVMWTIPSTFWSSGQKDEVMIATTIKTVNAC